MTSPRFADPTIEEESSDRWILPGAPSVSEFGRADKGGRSRTRRAVGSSIDKGSLVESADFAEVP